MADALLDVEDLTAGYGGGVVVEGLSLGIRAGEAVALMGRNGVGKTTLLRTIMGLLRPRAGRIRFGGVDIAGSEPFKVARAGIGYVPQGREVFPDLTVEENLLAGRLSAPDASAAFAVFPALAARRGERAGRLSGGQQQQLSVARALMAEPRLLLLDEPSEGVQPSVVEDITEALKRVSAERGFSILLVEQNIDMALALCSRALFLDAGHIVAEAPTEVLARDPSLIERHVGL
jgi:urea ABC transporter ATP-binding protein UrtE